MQTWHFALATFDSLPSILKTPQCFLYISPLVTKKPLQLSPSNHFPQLWCEAALSFTHRRWLFPSPGTLCSEFSQPLLIADCILVTLSCPISPTEGGTWKWMWTGCIVSSEVFQTGNKCPIPGGIQTEGSWRVRDCAVNFLPLFKGWSKGPLNPLLTLRFY